MTDNFILLYMEDRVGHELRYKTAFINFLK